MYFYCSWRHAGKKNLYVRAPFLPWDRSAHPPQLFDVFLLISLWHQYRDHIFFHFYIFCLNFFNVFPKASKTGTKVIANTKQLMLVNIYSPVKSQKQNNTSERVREEISQTHSCHALPYWWKPRTNRTRRKATCCQEKCVQLTLYHILHSKERSLHDSGRKSSI